MPRDTTEEAGTLAAPAVRGDHPVWADRGRRAEVRFVGRGPDAAADASRAAVLAAVVTGEPSPPAALAAARQVHGATVLEPPADAASPAGHAIACGEGDALVTDRPGLALSVITADCVPVLVEAGGRIAAVHAGWRGLVAGVIEATVHRLAAAGAPPRGEWIAWIGPTIGACCYEVDEDVATRVAAATSPEVVSRPGPKPHLDLVAAARHQLAARGVRDLRVVSPCTRCEPRLLWSYRREGARAGRNHAFIWIPGDPGSNAA
ncbi:MAG TPA: peptidoglycan editing factor PgeF [Thermoanaerobaculia bacterium]